MGPQYVNKTNWRSAQTVPLDIKIRLEKVSGQFMENSDFHPFATFFDPKTAYFGLFWPKTGLFSGFSKSNENSDSSFEISVKNEMNHPRGCLEKQNYFEIFFFRFLS